MLVEKERTINQLTRDSKSNYTYHGFFSTHQSLKNDLKMLKDEVSKAENAATAIEKAYNKELEIEKELRTQFELLMNPAKKHTRN